jgi:hypothetical protein
MCAVCSGCNTQVGHEKAGELKQVTAMQGDKEVYVATLCKDCNKKFEQGHFCPVCTKTFNELEMKSSPKKRRSIQKSAVSNDLERCTQCDRRVHYACDERVARDRGEPDEYKCAVCRAMEKTDPDSDDENFKRELKMPADRSKRRGRPRKYPVNVVPTVEEMRDRKKIRKRNVVVFKKNQIVAPITKMLI